MQASAIYSVSPSFNSYSSDKFSEIAARVVEELNQEQQGSSSEAQHDINIFTWDDQEPEKTPHFHAQKQLDLQPEECQEHDDHDDDHDDDDDDEFEFAVVYNDQDEETSADEIFYNGQIKPIYYYPVFNRDMLLFQDVNNNPDKEKDTKKSSASQAAIRLPLSKLFREEQAETTTSCSSSDDELEGVKPGTYCVWKPKAEQQCKKSNSTGSSSKRWKFRDLLQRSNSDGKETFVFLTTLSKKMAEKEKKGNGNCVVEKKKKKNKSSKHEFLGLFTNVNGLSRNLHPF